MRGPGEVLAAMGGTSSSADLLAHCTKAAVRTAVDDGDILRPRRGTYVLPSAPDPRRSAARIGGVASHESAAVCWGMELLQPTPQVHVTIARSRRRVDAAGAVLHWANVPRSDIHDRVTAPLRTVVDCARTSPFAQALSIADSALRLRLVTTDDLVAAAEALRQGRADNEPCAWPGQPTPGRERPRCRAPCLADRGPDPRLRTPGGDPRRRFGVRVDSATAGVGSSSRPRASTTTGTARRSPGLPAVHGAEDPRMAGA